MHAGATRSRDHDGRDLVRQGTLEDAGDFLAFHRAHGSADEAEIHRAEHHTVPSDERLPDHDSFGQLALLSRRLERDGVGLGRDEAEFVRLCGKAGGAISVSGASFHGFQA